MQELDEVIQFIIDALSANAAKGQGSVVSIRVAPYAKGKQSPPTKPEVLTSDDVLDAHEVLKTFNGDFKKIFGVRKTQSDA
ncbi:MAG: hypothetical protein AAB647_04020 [Patescibacteria group bacterium]